MWDTRYPPYRIKASDRFREDLTINIAHYLAVSDALQDALNRALSACYPRVRREAVHRSGGPGRVG